MKLIMRVDRTADPYNLDWENDLFVTKRISDEAKKLYMESEADVEEVTEKTHTSQGFYWVQAGLFIGCAVFLSLSHGDENSLFRYISNAFLLSLILYWEYHRVRKHRALHGASAQRLKERNHTIQQMAKEKLEYPEKYYAMDLMEFVYETEILDGQTREISYVSGDYSNSQMAVYVTEEKLCIASCYEKLEIPLEAICGITEVEEECTLNRWNKPAAYNSDRYLSYGIREDKDGNIVIHSYCVIHIQNEDEEYGILIPAYERARMEKLLSVEKQASNTKQ